MIKSILKITACGLVAAVVSAPAFAQSPQALKALQGTQGGSALLEQVLKVQKGASAAEITAKIAALPAKEAAAVLSAIKLFEMAVKPVAGNLQQQAQAKAANSALAEKMFAPNGQVFQLADLTQRYASTASVDKAVDARKKTENQCSSELDSSAMIAGTRISFATAEAIKKAGVVKRGKCETDPVKMSKEARENLLQYGECTLAAGASQTDCMIEAFRDNGVTLTAAQAAGKINDIADKCGYIRPVANR